MTTIKSQESLVEKNQEALFHFLSDMNNLQTLMPSQVTDWKSNAMECSFKVTGLTGIALKIKSTEPFSLIRYSETGKMPFAFELKAHFKPHETDNSKTWTSLSFEADLNPMLKMMVEKPLTNFINLLASRLPDLAGKF
jgi:carbon monoxide dehydrogenase subunit G